MDIIEKIVGRGGRVLGNWENNHVNAAVDTSIDFGSNVGSNIKQHGVEYIVVGSLIASPVFVSGCGTKEETKEEYAAKQVEIYKQGQRNQYIDDLKVKIIPGLQGQITDLGTNLESKIVTAKEEILTEMDKKIDPIITSMDKLSADFTAYLEKQESQVNVPSGRGRGNVCYDMPYSSGVIGISFTNSETQKFERWAGYRNFRNAFPNVPRWFDGDYRNGEGHKLHVSALGEHRVYSNDGNPIYRNSSNSWGLAESYHADTGRGTLQYESNFKPRCR